MKFYKTPLQKIFCGMFTVALSYNASAVVFENNSAQSLTTQAVANEAQPARIIVKYKQRFSTAQALSSPSNVTAQVSSATGTNMEYVRQTATGAHIMRTSGNATQAQLQQTLDTLAADPAVEYAEPDIRMTIQATPSDPQYVNQWHYFEALGGLNLPTAWDTSTGEGVVVAVIDTGYTAHADLNANMLPGYDMISDANTANDGNGRDSDARDTGDATSANECGSGSRASTSSWHGTHVAGTVAAVTNNGIGVAGVAYDAKILPIRALGKCGGFNSDISDGIIWAAGGRVPGLPLNPNPAQVINMSLGGGGACGRTSQAAINQAVSLGATIVVAAGNSNQNASTATPANCNNVVTVAAVGRNGGRASYSNFGSVVDVAAPGGDQRFGNASGVLSTLDSGSRGPAADTYGYYQGTSMASPHVAGAVALMYALDADITPAQVESILKTTSRSFPAACNSCGAGIVDATAAVAELSDAPIEEPPVNGDNALENGVAVRDLSGARGAASAYTVEIPEGATNLSIQLSGGSGDADLYVSFASQPTTSNYECRSWATGNDEACAFEAPQAGTYNVLVQAYAAYSGASIVASFETNDDTTPPVEAPTIDETNLSGDRGQWLGFEIEVPAGSSALQVTMNGGQGDADLYVRRGRNPTQNRYECRSWDNGNDESCTLNNPEAGTWFVRVRGYSAFSGANLQAVIQ